MFLYCNCLNLKVSFKFIDHVKQKVQLQSLNLTNNEFGDRFFTEDLSHVEVLNFEKVIPELCSVNDVGRWSIYTCRNCCTSIYAKANELELVKSVQIKNKAEVTKIRNDQDFSPIFNIIIRPDKDLVEAKGDNASTSLNKIKVQLNDAVIEESEKTEERIRLYSNKQHAALKEFKEKAQTDYKTLFNILSEDQSQFLDINKTSTVLTSDGKEIITSSSDESNQHENKTEPSIPSKTEKVNNEFDYPRPNISLPLKIMNRTLSRSLGLNPNRPVVMLHPQKLSNSLDSEGLFNIESIDGKDDIDDHILEEGSDTDLEDEDLDEHVLLESDTDREESNSYDETITIEHPCKRGREHSVASSLPVDVPRKLQLNMENDNVEDGLTTIDDIAASIEQLSSVHNHDSVFGDLPRPIRPRYNGSPL